MCPGKSEESGSHVEDNLCEIVEHMAKPGIAIHMVSPPLAPPSPFEFLQPLLPLPRGPFHAGMLAARWSLLLGAPVLLHMQSRCEWHKLHARTGE